MNLHISSLLTFLIISFSVVNLNANKKYWWLSPWCHCIFLYKKFDVFYEFQVSLIIFYHFGCIKKKQFNNRMYVYYIYTNLCHTVVDMIVSFYIFWNFYSGLFLNLHIKHARILVCKYLYCNIYSLCCVIHFQLTTTYLVYVKFHYTYVEYNIPLIFYHRDICNYLKVSLFFNHCYITREALWHV